MTSPGPTRRSGGPAISSTRWNRSWRPPTGTTTRSPAVHARAAARRGALFFAELAIGLLAGEIAEFEAADAGLRTTLEEAERTRDELSPTRDRLIEERAAADGDRIGELERRAGDARRDEQVRGARHGRLAAQLAAAGLGPVHDADAFAALPAQIGAQREMLERSRAQLVERITAILGRRNDLQRSSSEIRAELESLARRRNNLPLSHLDVRAQLCRDLRMDTESLPFAGELIDVADGFRALPRRGGAGSARLCAVPAHPAGPLRSSPTANDGATRRRRHRPGSLVSIPASRPATPDLVTDRLEKALRLEQERIDWAWTRIRLPYSRSDGTGGPA